MSKVLPKKVNRIAAADRSSAFMGSDFTYSDIDGPKIDDFEYTLINDSDPVDGVDSVFRIGLDVGEGRGTNVGVGIGIAKGVAVASRFGGSAMGVFNGATIAKGADVGVTMMDGSDESLQADMMAITIKIIGMTLVFRST